MVRKFLLLLVATSALAGCLATMGGPAATVTTITPAQSSAAARLKDLAVLPFDGVNGKQLSTDIEGVLASVQLGESPYFHIAERQSIDTVLREIKFSQSGMVNREQGLRLGKLLGVKGLYIGSANAPTTHENSYQESRSTCAEEDTSKKNFLGGHPCKRFTETKVTCYKREASYSFTPKLVEIESGKIVYSNNIKGSAQAQSCQDQNTPTPSLAQLVEAAKLNALEIFRKEVAPSFSSIDVKLMASDEAIADDANKRKLSQGIEFAKGKRLDRACELWQGIDSGAAARSPSVFFNLGVCAEMSGDLVKATDLYKKADRLLEKPDDQISAALVRVEKSRRDMLKFGKQLN